MSEILVCEREVWGRVHPVRLTGEDRRYHKYVVGKTGSGKSTLLRTLFVQEMALRLHRRFGRDCAPPRDNRADCLQQAETLINAPLPLRLTDLDPEHPYLREH